MKRLLGLFLLFAFILQIHAAPLIFKATKEISAAGFIEFGTFDTGKYRQIKINVTGQGRYFRLRTLGSEGAENFDIVLDSTDTQAESYTRVIDLPPSKVRVMIEGEGTYKLYVWAVQ